MSKEELEGAVLRQLGDPRQVARELKEYQRAAKTLSSKHPRMIERFPKQWVVIYQGKVQARGQTMQSALLQAEQKQLPAEHVIVRYIDRNERTFIL